MSVQCKLQIVARFVIKKKKNKCKYIQKNISQIPLLLFPIMINLKHFKCIHDLGSSLTMRMLCSKHYCNVCNLKCFEWAVV